MTLNVEDCEYIQYELEEDGNNYYFCKIAPTGTDEQCCNFPNCHYKRYLKSQQELLKVQEENKELKEVLTHFDILYAKDEETGNLYGRCQKLYNVEKQIKYIKAACKVVLDITPEDKLLQADKEPEYLLAKYLMEIIEDVKYE